MGERDKVQNVNSKIFCVSIWINAHSIQRMSCTMLIREVASIQNINAHFGKFLTFAARSLMTNDDVIGTLTRGFAENEAIAPPPMIRAEETPSSHQHALSSLTVVLVVVACVVVAVAIVI